MFCARVTISASRPRHPVDRPRMEALTDEGRQAVVVVLGLVGAFVVAGLIEGSVSESDLRDIDRDGSLDAAWLVEHASFEDPSDRARRLQQFTFGQRVFAGAPPSDLPHALVAVAAYPAYPTLFQTLDRAGVRDPETYAVSARRARALSALTGPRAAIAPMLT